MPNKKDRFTELHDRYYPLVFSTVKTKVESLDDVLDICQEVFIVFFEKLEEVENPRKWLYGALRLSVFEYYRKKNSEANIDEVFEDVSITFVNGFRDARIIIAEALEHEKNFSGDDDRILFDLIAVYNFSYSEAARELGLTKRIVEYRYGRIVERILDSLKRKGIKNLEELL